MKNRRAPGICDITTEMLKAGGTTTAIWLTNVFNTVWSTEIIPDNWRKGLILPFWKRKGDLHDCSNYRGITLLSIPGKLFCRILINRARPALMHHRRPQQAGFTPGRGTTDHISTVRLLIEKAHEFRRNHDLCLAFIDLKAAFDSVNRDSIWLVLKSINVPDKIVRLLKLIYSDTESSVRINGKESTSFHVSTGVRQGCTAAPDLFNCLLDYLMQKVSDRSSGIILSGHPLKDLEYADDTVLLSRGGHR